MEVFNPNDEDSRAGSQAKRLEYYKPKDVAEILRVPIKWVYERTRSGQIPVRKFGGHVRIPVDEFEAWEKEQTGVARQA